MAFTALRIGYDRAGWFVSLDILRADIGIDCEVCSVCRGEQA